MNEKFDGEVKKKRKENQEKKFHDSLMGVVVEVVVGGFVAEVKKNNKH